MKREWAAANPQRRAVTLHRWYKKAVAEGRDYYSRNRDSITAAWRERRLTDPEWAAAGRDRSKAYYAQHRERLMKQNRAYYQAHKAELRAYAKRWYQANKERHRANWKRWVAANPERWRAIIRKCKDQRRGADGHFTGIELLERYQEQCGLCAYCLAPLGEDYHAEHVIPLARGGTNWIDNVVCACAGCNLSKGAKSVIEFLRYLQDKTS